MADKPTTVFTVNKPKCVNMYACLTAYGVTKAHLVTGTTGMTSGFKTKRGNLAKIITTGKYKAVLLETLTAA